MIKTFELEKSFDEVKETEGYNVKELYSIFPLPRLQKLSDMKQLLQITIEELEKMIPAKKYSFSIRILRECINELDFLISILEIHEKFPPEEIETPF